MLDLVLGYLDSVDGASARTHRERITPLAGEAAGWERPAAMFDPAQSIGLSAPATESRLPTDRGTQSPAGWSLTRSCATHRSLRRSCRLSNFQPNYDSGWNSRFAAEFIQLSDPPNVAQA